MTDYLPTIAASIVAFIAGLVIYSLMKTAKRSDERAEAMVPTADAEVLSAIWQQEAAIMARRGQVREAERHSRRLAALGWALERGELIFANPEGLYIDDGLNDDGREPTIFSIADALWADEFDGHDPADLSEQAGEED